MLCTGEDSFEIGGHVLELWPASVQQDWDLELLVCSSNRACVTCAENHFVMTGHCGVLLCWGFFTEL